MSAKSARKSARSTVAAVRFRCMVVLVILALLEVGPIPIAPFFGMYLVLRRPSWLPDLVRKLYADKREASPLDKG